MIMKSRLDSPSTYLAKVARLSAALRENPALPVRLGKKTSNLFRPRQTGAVQRLDVTGLNKVVRIDAQNLVAEVEGIMTYQELTKVTLEHGFVPTVVPELATITIGGALAGGGIESSSFRYGLVHETIKSMDVLTASGDVITAAPDGDHADLYAGLPNTFGTLGYVVKVTVGLVKSRPYVHLRHKKYDAAADYFAALAQVADSGEQDGQPIDYLDGVVFGADQFVLTTGRFVETAPYASNYTRHRIYYQSLLTQEEDYLTTYDYLWRWDTDWFWCSKRMYAQHPAVRLLFGRWLGSKTYWKLAGLDGKYHIQDRISRLTGRTQREEMVIQDVQIPIEHALTFLEFMERHIGITPIWTCPARAYNPKQHFPFYELEPGKLYINFGFWDGVSSDRDPAEGYYNRLLEAQVDQLQGKKGLYSESFYSREQFWQIYPKPTYDKLKKRYDPAGRLRDIYDKTVKRG